MTRPHSAVITGASSGIGKALAFELAARGYALGLASRRISRLQDIRDALHTKHPEVKVELAELDVDQVYTVKACLDDLFTRMGGVDIVVANAGVNRFTRVGRDELADELQILQTNVLGAVATIQAASAYFLGRGRGQLVGVSSLAAENAMPTQSAYCASKAALSMYLDIARMELSRKGIVVTTILPGFVETEIMEDIGKYPFHRIGRQGCCRDGEHYRERSGRRRGPCLPEEVRQALLQNHSRRRLPQVEVRT